jgi:hypothetical protein
MWDNYLQVKETEIKLELNGLWSPSFSTTALKRENNIFCKLCEDHKPSGYRKSFKISVFYFCLEIMITQLNQRFQGLRRITKYGIIFPKNLLAATDKELYDGSVAFVKNGKIFCKNFCKCWLIVFKTEVNKETISEAYGDTKIKWTINNIY